MRWIYSSHILSVWALYSFTALQNHPHEHERRAEAENGEKAKDKKRYWTLHIAVWTRRTPLHIAVVTTDCSVPDSTMCTCSLSIWIELHSIRLVLVLDQTKFCGRFCPKLKLVLCLFVLHCKIQYCITSILLWNYTDIVDTFAIHELRYLVML